MLAVWYLLAQGVAGTSMRLLTSVDRLNHHVDEAWWVGIVGIVAVLLVTPTTICVALRGFVGPAGGIARGTTTLRHRSFPPRAWRCSAEVLVPARYASSSWWRIVSESVVPRGSWLPSGAAAGCAAFLGGVGGTVGGHAAPLIQRWPRWAAVAVLAHGGKLLSFAAAACLSISMLSEVVPCCVLWAVLVGGYAWLAVFTHQCAAFERRLQNYCRGCSWALLSVAAALCGIDKAAQTSLYDSGGSTIVAAGTLVCTMLLVAGRLWERLAVFSQSRKLASNGTTPQPPEMDQPHATCCAQSSAGTPALPVALLLAPTGHFIAGSELRQELHMSTVAALRAIVLHITSARCARHPRTAVDFAEDLCVTLLG